MGTSVEESLFLTSYFETSPFKKKIKTGQSPYSLLWLSGLFPLVGQSSSFCTEGADWGR